jgi:lysozyme family protein
MVVNMGKRRAVKILQRALNAVGSDLEVDGGIGDKTIAATKNTKLELARLRSYRVLYYADLVNRRPVLQKYWYGWYKRSLRV